MMKCTYRDFATGAIVLIALFMVNAAFAHIKSDASQFPDIEYSDARFDIVLLVGAGIIPETPVFEPDRPFSRANLAAWAALAEGLGRGGETPDTRTLAARAVEQGLIDSLEGDASYQAINDVFFNGQVTVKQPGAVPTKAEAASFLAAHLDTKVGGESLLEKRDLVSGPTGEVVKVESGTSPDGDTGYSITIGGETHMMSEHGRVANGPTDLILWKGRKVRRSFLHREDDEVRWAYLEAEPVQAAANAGETAGAAEQDKPRPLENNRGLLYSLVAAVVVLGLLLFFRRKRVS